VTRQTNFDPRWARHGFAYVVVADGGRARIFRRSGPRSSSRLLEIGHLERPNAHRHARDLTTDLTGRVPSDYDPRAVEVERFARRLSARIAGLAQAERIEEMVLIAEPRFLGILRRELPEPLRQIITREIPRNLTASMPAPIARAAFELTAAPVTGRQG